MVDSPWRRCIRDGAVVLSVATNAAYVEHVQQLASTAEVPCVIVACSSLVVPSLGSSNVQLMQLPYSSTWRPPPRWCQQRKAGWRHAAILKLEALLHLLVAGVDVLVLDADWRVRAGQNPVHAARSTGRDVVGLRDVTRHQLNIGAVYVRSTAGTVHAVRRAFNRTHVAWDQPVLTEEFGAAEGVACCWTADLRGAIERPRGRMATRGQKAYMQQLDTHCRPAASGLHALAPPSLLPSGTRSFWHERWSPNRFNELARRYYEWRCNRCDSKCVLERCELNASSPLPPVTRVDAPPAARRPVLQGRAHGGTRGGRGRAAAGCTMRSGCCARHPRAPGCAKNHQY